MNKLQSIKEQCTLIASQEDDRRRYDEECAKADYEFPTGMQWNLYADYYDVMIFKKGYYYIVNDCGLKSLYKFKNKN